MSQPPPGLPPPGFPHAQPAQLTFYQSNPTAFPPLRYAAAGSPLVPLPPAFVPPGFASQSRPYTSTSAHTPSGSASAPLSRSTSATTPPVAPVGDLTPGQKDDQIRQSNKLDRFAAVYVSKWLLDVNAAQPRQTIVPENSRSQDVFAYADAIYPKALLDEYNVQEELASGRTASTMHLPTSKLAGADAVDLGYAAKLTGLQVAEHRQRKQDLALAAQFKVPLEIYNADDTHGSKLGTKGLYQLTIPALREGWPALDINDVVLLRQVYPVQQDWQGIEFVATVWAVQRARATIILKCDALHRNRVSMLFNIQFRPQGES